MLVVQSSGVSCDWSLVSFSKIGMVCCVDDLLMCVVNSAGYCVHVRGFEGGWGGYELLFDYLL